MPKEPANRATRSKKPADTNEYARFESLTRKLVNVPKKELDKARAKARRSA